MLHRNRRLLLWWSQQKKEVNDVNLQFDNGQSGHGPPRGGHGRIAPLDPPVGSHALKPGDYVPYASKFFPRTLYTRMLLYRFLRRMLTRDLFAVAR